MYIAAVAQGVSIYYSFRFFNDINPFFGVIIVLFESVTFFYMPRLVQSKDLSIKVLMGIIVAMTCLFSIFGVVSNGYNFITQNNQSQYRMETNPKYTDYLSNKKTKQQTLEAYKQELQKYPTFEEYTKNSPSWENKTNLNKSYIDGKTKIEDNIAKTQSEIDKTVIPEKEIKIKIKTTGYNEMLNKISEITSFNVETIILILMSIVAVLLQLIILTARLYKSKSKDFSKTYLDNPSTQVEQNDEIFLKSEIPETFDNTGVDTALKDTTSVKIGVLENKIPETLDAIGLQESPSIPVNEVLEQNKDNVLENKNSLGESKDNVPENKDVLEDIKKYLRDNYKKNEVIPKFKCKFNLTEYEYKTIRNELVNEKIIECKNKRMYYIYQSKIRAIK